MLRLWCTSYVCIGYYNIVNYYYHYKLCQNIQLSTCFGNSEDKVKIITEILCKSVLFCTAVIYYYYGSNVRSYYLSLELVRNFIIVSYNGA